MSALRIFALSLLFSITLGFPVQTVSADSSLPGIADTDIADTLGNKAEQGVKTFALIMKIAVAMLATIALIMCGNYAKSGQMQMALFSFVAAVIIASSLGIVEQLVK